MIRAAVIDLLSLNVFNVPSTLAQDIILRRRVVRDDEIAVLALAYMNERDSIREAFDQVLAIFFGIHPLSCADRSSPVNEFERNTRRICYRAHYLRDKGNLCTDTKGLCQGRSTTTYRLTWVCSCPSIRNSDESPCSWVALWICKIVTGLNVAASTR